MNNIVTFCFSLCRRTSRIVSCVQVSRFVTPRGTNSAWRNEISFQHSCACNPWSVELVFSLSCIWMMYSTSLALLFHKCLSKWGFADVFWFFPVVDRCRWVVQFGRCQTCRASHENEYLVNKWSCLYFLWCLFQNYIVRIETKKETWKDIFDSVFMGSLWFKCCRTRISPSIARYVFDDSWDNATKQTKLRWPIRSTFWKSKPEQRTSGTSWKADNILSIMWEGRDLICLDSWQLITTALQVCDGFEAEVIGRFLVKTRVWSHREVIFLGIVSLQRFNCSCWESTVALAGWKRSEPWPVVSLLASSWGRASAQLKIVRTLKIEKKPESGCCFLWLLARERHQRQKKNWGCSNQDTKGWCTSQYDHVDAPCEAPEPAHEHEGDSEELRAADEQVCAEDGCLLVLSLWLDANLGAAEDAEAAQDGSCHGGGNSEKGWTLLLSYRFGKQMVKLFCPVLVLSLNESEKRKWPQLSTSSTRNVVQTFPQHVLFVIDKLQGTLKGRNSGQVRFIQTCSRQEDVHH